MPDVQEGDVSFNDEATARFLGGNLLNNFEREIISVLGRLLGHKPSDVDLRYSIAHLSRLYAYRSVSFDGLDDCLRFSSLMLVCATFLKRKEDRELYVKKLEEWMNGRWEAENVTEAYILLALFVALRSPALRDAIKVFKSKHEDCPESFLQMFSKVKRIRCR